ncbi:MAG: glycosyltransferase family 4 protein [Paludibacteraceae bacterium]|nr:glycosyltransferase family 4 protein [Paludibacteraceae bacterium]
MRVLFLTPWYPSEKDAMLGLFVQKHAEAVRAQGCEVRVIFSQGWLDTWRQWRTLRREGWMPDVVQLNVIQKQGLLALWLKHRYGVPYVIIEHFTGYLPSGNTISSHSLHTAFMRYICQNAEAVMPVSEDLQKAMQALGFKAKRWKMIDNVVDDFFFEISRYRNIEIPNHRKTLLHISCFDEPHKNVKGLLRAAKMLSEKRQDWQLVLVGTGVDYKDVRAYAESLNIPKGILRWTGELTPREVAEEMAHADAFVLSSRYETYGVVLAEAAAAGLPILSTPVGIAEEIADLIVPQEIAQYKPGKFAEFIEAILWSPEAVSKVSPVSDFSRFSAEAVGKQLKEIYEEVR